MAEVQAKRPPKHRIVQFTISLFDLLKGGHIDEATVSSQLKASGMYLYTGEVDKIVEKEQEANPSFDGDGYAQMLFDADILVEGTAPVFGGGGDRINSKERALQVANNPKDADLIVELVTEALAIKKRVNDLVSEKAVFSYALKNKKPVKRESSKKDAVTASDLD